MISMKKLFLCIVLIIFIFPWVGCESEKNNEYSVSGYILTTEQDPLAGIKIYFGEFGSSETTSEGFWSKHHLAGPVVITPVSLEWDFIPAALDVEQESHDLIFWAYIDEEEEAFLQLQWETKLTSEPITTTLAVYNQFIYVGTSEGLFALDLKGDIIWRYQEDFSFYTPVVCSTGQIYCGSDTAILHFVNPTGATNWEIFAKVSGAKAMGFGPQPADRTLLWGDEDGDIHIYLLSQNYQISYSANSKLKGVALGDNNLIYAGDQDGKLHCFFLDWDPDGYLLSHYWAFAGGGSVVSAPTPAPDGIVYFGNNEGIIYALSNMGNKLWEYDAGSPVKTQITLGHFGNLYFGVESGLVIALDQDGSKLWEYNAKSPVYAAPLMGESAIYIATEGGIVQALSYGGDELGFFKTRGSIIGSLKMTEDSTILCTDSAGYLYALQPENEQQTYLSAWPEFQKDQQNRGHAQREVLTMHSANPADGFIFLDYSHYFRAWGGRAPYQFQIIGGNLPQGLELTATGHLRGIPLQSSLGPGLGFSFEVQVTDKLLTTNSHNFELHIIPPEISLPADRHPPVGYRDEPYSFDLEPEGGAAPFTFEITEGELPPGLNLDPQEGNIAGIPQLFGEYPYVIKIEDSWGQYYFADFCHVIREKPGHKVWTYELQFMNQATPSLSFEGDIFINDLDSLLAINPQGEKIWRYKSFFSNTHANAVGSEGNIYSLSLSSVYAISPAGDLLWEYPLDELSYERASPAIGTDGTIYISWEKGILALNEDGHFKWKYTFVPREGLEDEMTHSDILIAQDNTLYFGTYSTLAHWQGQGGRLFALNQEGEEKWILPLGYDTISSPAIDNQGNVVVAAASAIYKVEGTTGTILWTFSFPDGEDKLWRSSPILDDEGNIYAGTVEGYLYALCGEGNLRWRFGGVMEGGIWSTPVLGDDGMIYVGTLAGNMHCLSADNGVLQWTYQGGCEILSSPVLSCDGVLYFTSFLNKKLHAVQTASTGILVSSWPRHCGDAQSTGQQQK